MKRPILSVVIPTRNRGDWLRATLDSVLAQRVGVPYEVIVVDNNSSDSTPEIVRSYGGVRYVLEKRPGAANARNSGIEQSNGDVVVFIDDDAVAEADWLEELHRVYRQKPDAWCVGGKILSGLPESVPVWFERSAQALSGYIAVMDRGVETFKMPYPGDVWGPNFSLSRVAVERVGGFRTDLGPLGTRRLAGEETELCWRIHRAGGGVYYCGRAVVTHFVPPSYLTPAYFRRRAYWYGRTDRLLGMKRPPLRQILLLLAWKPYRAIVGRPLSSARAFANALDAWWYLGHLHQSFMQVCPSLHTGGSSKRRAGPAWESLAPRLEGSPQGKRCGP